MGKLGDTLRERRIALGLSIEQVQEGTHIRGRLLEAIEEGNYDRLPNPGYVRGYVSSYARFLELDPVPLLNMYKAETGVGRQHQLNLPQTSEAVAPTGQQHAFPVRAAVTIAVIVALVALVAWALTRIWSGPEPAPVEPTAITEPQPATSEQTPAPETTKSTDAAAVEEAPAEKQPQPFTLAVRVAADGASWLRVKVDGKVAYEGVLTGGQSKEYEVTKTATLRIGKPESVTILRDGNEVAVKDTGDIGSITLKAKPTE